MMLAEKLMSYKNTMVLLYFRFEETWSHIRNVNPVESNQDEQSQ